MLVYFCCQGVSFLLVPHHWQNPLMKLATINQHMWPSFLLRDPSPQGSPHPSPWTLQPCEAQLAPQYPDAFAPSPVVVTPSLRQEFPKRTAVGACGILVQMKHSTQVHKYLHKRARKNVKDNTRNEHQQTQKKVADIHRHMHLEREREKGHTRGTRADGVSAFEDKPFTNEE